LAFIIAQIAKMLHHGNSRIGDQGTAASSVFLIKGAGGIEMPARAIDARR
jgi:hypothetical protein